MKKYLPVLLLLSGFFSMKSYAQSTTSNDLNHNTVSVDKDAMNWELSYDFMGIDAGARQATCTGDVIDPVIFCPQDFFVQATNSCEVFVSSYPFPSVSDNCPGVSVQCNPPPLSFFSVGTTTITCTAMDASNNTADCTFDVIVVDDQPPSVSCPEDIIAQTDPGMCSAVVAWSVPLGWDCDDVSVQCDAPPGNVFPMGATNVTCTATDLSGNMSSCSFYVIVLDNEPTQIVCPDDIEVSPNPNTCDAVVTWSPIVTDNCDSGLMTICDIPSGSTFPVGTTSVFCLITDPSTTIICQFDVTVTDDCFANCPSIITLNNTTVNGLYHAENSVTATNTITSGTNTNFKAGNVIELNNDFTAPANTNFSAEIEDCTTNFGPDGDQN